MLRANERPPVLASRRGHVHAERGVAETGNRRLYGGGDGHEFVRGMRTRDSPARGVLRLWCAIAPGGRAAAVSARPALAARARRITPLGGHRDPAAPAKRNTAACAERTTPARDHQDSPACAERTTPARGHQNSPACAERTTPARGHQDSPACAQRITADPDHRDTAARGQRANQRERAVAALGERTVAASGGRAVAAPGWPTAAAAPSGDRGSGRGRGGARRPGGLAADQPVGPPRAPRGAIVRQRRAAGYDGVRVTLLPGR